jgi:hypothetical protein
VHHPVAVPLEVVAVTVGRLGNPASTRILDADRVLGEHAKSLAELVGAGTGNKRILLVEL